MSKLMYILSKCKREQQHGAKIGSLLKKQLESSHCQPVSFWTLQRLSQMNNSTSLDSETEKTSSLVKFKKHLKSKQLNLSSGSTSYQFSNHMWPLRKRWEVLWSSRREAAGAGGWAGVSPPSWLDAMCTLRVNEPKLLTWDWANDLMSLPPSFLN